MPSVLIISNAGLDEAMVGSSIRAYEIARVLAAEARVTLAAPSITAALPDGIAGVRYDYHRPDALRDPIARADLVIAQPHYPVVARWLARAAATVVYDLYDPESFEVMALFAESDPRYRRLHLVLALDRLLGALEHGDYFVCASETQRDLWLGAMLSRGLISADLCDRDPSLSSVIGLVPFGLPSEPPPVSDARPIRARFPTLSEQDEIVLWNGGLWNWLDGAGAVRALARLRARRPHARLVFMGARELPESAIAIRATRAAMAAAGLTDRDVLFNDGWVPYGERARWLQEADCAVASALDHLETRFAFRTRLLDCFWSGLPVACTLGDDLADRVHRAGLGATAPAGDDEALAGALETVLQRGRASYAEPLRAAAADFAWPRVCEPLLRLVRGELQPARRVHRPRARGAVGPRVRAAAYRAGHRPLYALFQVRRRLRGG